MKNYLQLAGLLVLVIVGTACGTESKNRTETAIPGGEAESGQSAFTFGPNSSSSGSAPVPSSPNSAPGPQSAAPVPSPTGRTGTAGECSTEGEFKMWMEVLSSSQAMYTYQAVIDFGCKLQTLTAPQCRITKINIATCKEVGGALKWVGQSKTSLACYGTKLASAKCFDGTTVRYQKLCVMNQSTGTCD